MSSHSFTSYYSLPKLLGDIRLSQMLKSVKLHDSFQRHGCWDKFLKERFVTSVLLSNAPSPIILCDIEASMLKAIKNSPDYKFFKALLDAGHKYISIDGNNRTQTLISFFDNEVSVLHGTYNVPGKNTTVTIDKSNDTWSKLPESLVDYVTENTEVNILIYTVATRQELSTLFLNINDGLDLNAQEKRNARLVDFATEIRELARNFEASFSNVYKKGNLRYVIDELLVKLVLIHTYGTENGITKGVLDDAYEDGSDAWKNFASFDGRKSLVKFLSFMRDYSDTNLRLPSTVINMYMMICHIEKENYEITDAKEFYKWFMKTESARMGDTTTIRYSNTNTGATFTYSELCKGTARVDLKGREEALIEDFKSIPEGIVSVKPEEDSQRLFTKGQKYKVWERQNGICPKTGKTIPEGEIFNEEKWHADHIVPHSKGGKTTLENCQLVDASWNLKKSNRLEEELTA